MNDSIQIIEGCKKGDRLSQEKLYRQFYPALFALCKTFFDDHHDILTALNNGMLKVYKNIDQFDETKGSLFNWIYTVVRNAALTHVSNKNNKPSLVLTENIPDIHSYNPFKEKSWENIYQLLGQLPPTTRAICSLFYMEGFSIKEIAFSLTMKEGAIKWHLHESRKRLHTILQNNISKRV